tara:strand:- start:3057 stop:3233 length:177 start_codon:yes stop_codon:yes gene_type:complete
MTQHEALALALELAITAPTEADKERCVEMADGIAADMSADEIEQCKAAAVLAMARANQ